MAVFSQLEVGGLVLIAVVVAVLAWFTTDATGTTRLLSAALGGVGALLAGGVVLVVLSHYRGERESAAR